MADIKVKGKVSGNVWKRLKTKMSSKAVAATLAALLGGFSVFASFNEDAWDALGLVGVGIINFLASL